MRKIIMLVSAFGWLANVCATQGVSSNESSEADAHAAIVLINHIGWEVSRILAMSDGLSLEAEYEMISIDQLNLGTIKDKEIVEQIRGLCSYITQKRIAVGEREMLRREYDYNRDNALYDAFPSPSAILVADWRVIAYNLVQSTVCAYMSYKKAVAALKIKLERDQWELDKEMLNYLDELYQELLERQQRLIQHYKLDDYWRVSPKQAHDLVAHVENADTDERRADLFSYLNHALQRKAFQKLPAFWYYLGDVAERVGRKDVAMEAYDKYQKEYCQILRFDRTAASVAMNKANLLLEQSADASLVRKQLEIIEKNMSDDWTFMYYCANVYNKLRDTSNAHRTLDQANQILRDGFDNAMKNTEQLCGGTNELAVTDHSLPNALPMIACQVLKRQLDGETVNKDNVRKMLDESQRKWGRNCFGMLSFYGQIPFDEIAEYMRPCFKGIHLEYQHDDSLFNNSAPYRLILELPLDWFYAGPIDVSANFKFDDSSIEMEVGIHPRYEGVNPRITAERSVQYVLDCPSEIVRRRSPTRVELLLGHKLYPVTVVFDASQLKDVRKNGSKKVNLPLIEGRYKKKVFRL